MSTDALYRAERAKALLDDPLLKEAFDLFEGNFIEEMLSADATDDERRKAADRVNAFRAVRDLLRQHVNKAKPPQQQEIENLP